MQLMCNTKMQCSSVNSVSALVNEKSLLLEGGPFTLRPLAGRVPL
jgi:hypothetical protein